MKQCLDEASDVEAVDVGETPGGQALRAAEQIRDAHGVSHHADLRVLPFGRSDHAVVGIQLPLGGPNNFDAELKCSRSVVTNTLGLAG